MTETTSRELYVLAGPTAAGKSALAHTLAREHGWPVLSADAMLVYRGMDIGTAKPTRAEREGIRYGGMDLVTPDRPFSVGAWVEHARSFLGKISRGQRVVVVGGTGLYIKALLRGLDPMPTADKTIRDGAEALYAREGLAGLQAACREADAERFEALKDKANPRRVMRALELARMGVPMERVWEQGATGPIVVLNMERDLLSRRIAQRVEAMYAAGLLEEVRHLRDRYAGWSDTARMAIGYREALAVLNNEMTEDDAKKETKRRTVQLARRQMTWFRNQLPMVPVHITDAETASALARRVHGLWSEHGPCRINN